jgi:carnosine N-methyltransferase
MLASRNNRRRKDIFTLLCEDQVLIEQLGYRQKLAEIDDAILANAAFLGKIMANPAIFGNTDPSELEKGEAGGDFGENVDHEPREEGLHLSVNQ